MSGYGLSAFLFSTISHIFFVGSASPLLLLLSLGSSIPMILGFFFVCPVPLPEEELNREVYSETSSSAYERSISSRTPLLNDDDDEVPSMRSRNRETSRRSLSRGAAMALNMLPNVYGKKLLCSSDFWLLFGIHSIRTFSCLSTILFVISNILFVVSGTGLMCMSFQKDTLASLC
jgi:hypothetical protein